MSLLLLGVAGFATATDYSDFAMVGFVAAADYSKKKYEISRVSPTPS
jgi:hypothetical protein